MHEQLRWQACLKYLAFLKVMTVLWYLAGISSLVAAKIYQLDDKYVLLVLGVAVLQVVTAHINHHYISVLINAEDKYTFYPFF